jgi:hypothetical protein
MRPFSRYGYSAVFQLGGSEEPWTKIGLSVDEVETKITNFEKAL